MITLITGVAKSGKTYLAKEIVKRYQIPYFSTDYLMMSLSLGNPSIGVNHNDDDRIVAAALEPYLKPMIEAMIHNRIDYCIEGVHLLPSFVAKLKAKYPNDIQHICLGYAMIDTHLKVSQLREHLSTMENAWYKDFTDEQMVHLIEHMKKDSQAFMLDCLETHLDYCEIWDIVKQSDDIILKLSQKLR